MRLTTKLHERDAAGMTYVYPVVSRRAKGVSVGVNLNPNNACNWRCAYCQVPGLTLGVGPSIDLAALRSELASLLGAITHGDWMEENVPRGSRRLNDVAFSGNGEPTTSPDFGAAVEVVGDVLEDLDLAGNVPLVLITNGSQVHKAPIERGLRKLAALGGEVWFKLDSGTVEGRRRLNGVEVPDGRVVENLTRCAALARTRLQTMHLAMDGASPGAAEEQAWLELVKSAQDSGAHIADVLLYGLERESFQPEAARLEKLDAEVLEHFGTRITACTGLVVRVHP